MSNNKTNTPNGVGGKKEIKVKRNIPEEEINRAIENWASQKDEKGNIVPGTENTTIIVVFGNPYFKDNIANKEQETENSEGGNNDAESGTTVMTDQGSKDLQDVKEGLYIQTKPMTLEQSKDAEKKEKTSSKGKDEEDIRS